MKKKENKTILPSGYTHVAGSERRAFKEATLLGPANDNEKVLVTIVLRRRPDGPPMPDLDYFAKTPPLQHRRLSANEHAARYGAHPDELSRVIKFVEDAGFTIIDSHAGRRFVTVTGTVAQMNKAFAVKLNSYQRTVMRNDRRHKPQPFTETYRSHEGFVQAPADIASCIMGVFGLDTRNITRHSSYPPTLSSTDNTPGVITIQQVKELYQVPTNSAGTQTIGIFAAVWGSSSSPQSSAGFFTADITNYFDSISQTVPTVTAVSCIPGISDADSNNGVAYTTTQYTQSYTNFQLNVASTQGVFSGQTMWVPGFPDINDFQVNQVLSSTVITVHDMILNDVPAAVPLYLSADWNGTAEITQDICIAGAVAADANFKVFFCCGDEAGWINLMTTVSVDTECSVMSSSFFCASTDDPTDLSNGWGITQSQIDSLHSYYQDAANNLITVCSASGDWGSEADYQEGVASVQYPCSDPYVLSVGGTAIGNDGNSPLEEYIWNDVLNSAGLVVANLPTTAKWGATGGGVSACFTAVPPWQAAYGADPLPVTGGGQGRAMPDVAANASLNSAYTGLFLGGRVGTVANWFNGNGQLGNGSSAAAPFWAGLIATINAALNEQVGFINPFLYILGYNQFNGSGGLAVFNPITLSGGPNTNQVDTQTPGYTATGPGWNACTGWGSPKGANLLTALQALQQAFIFGGYQSADVILQYPSSITPPPNVTNRQVPIGGAPDGSGSTLLEPNVGYPLSAIIHNSSLVNTAVINSVSFWAVPGGLGVSGGTLLATVYASTRIPSVEQPFTIQPNSHIIVDSGTVFTNPGYHMCAAVSIYSPSSGWTFNGAADTNSQDIPNPGFPYSHSGSAWRNTDSMTGAPNTNFTINLGMGKLQKQKDKPVMIEIQSTHIPFNWNENAGIKTLQKQLDTARTASNVPLYTLPQFISTFENVDLKPGVTAVKGGKIESPETGMWQFVPNGKDVESWFEITAKVPANANEGDIIVITVTANYPESDGYQAQAVQFTEYVYVKGRK